jgi:hypothetical protein
VSFHVEGEVVGSAEGALALAAAEGLLTRVLPEMSSQLVGPRELPGAAVPRALVRFFPCVRPLVRLQMRTLRVNLVAPHHIAPVYFPPLHRRVRPPILADVIIVNGYVFAHRRFRWRPRDGYRGIFEFLQRQKRRRRRQRSRRDVLGYHIFRNIWWRLDFARWRRVAQPLGRVLGHLEHDGRLHAQIDGLHLDWGAFCLRRCGR